MGSLMLLALFLFDFFALCLSRKVQLSMTVFFSSTEYLNSWWVLLYNAIDQKPNTVPIEINGRFAFDITGGIAAVHMFTEGNQFPFFLHVNEVQISCSYKALLLCTLPDMQKQCFILGMVFSYEESIYIYILKASLKLCKIE